MKTGAFYITQRKNALTTCENILEAIEIYQRLINANKDNIRMFSMFGSYENAAKHNIEIYQMCIRRLWERYAKYHKLAGE